MNKRSKGTIAILLLFAIVLLASSIISGNQNRAFRDEGVSVAASVTDVFLNQEYSGSKTSSTSQKAHVVFYLEEGVDSIALVKGDKAKLDNLLEKLKYKDTFGNFVATDVMLSRDVYDTLKKGDLIELYYLPENPEDARVKALVDNYSLTILYIVIGFLFAAVAVVWLAARLRAKSA